MQKEDKSNEIRSCADLNTVEDNLKDRITLLHKVLHQIQYLRYYTRYIINCGIYMYGNPKERAMMRTGQQLRSFKWVTR